VVGSGRSQQELCAPHRCCLRSPPALDTSQLLTAQSHKQALTLEKRSDVAGSFMAFLVISLQGKRDLEVVWSLWSGLLPNAPEKERDKVILSMRMTRSCNGFAFC